MASNSRATPGNWRNRHCYLADPAYGEGVAKALGVDIKDVDMNDTYGARG